MTHAVASNGYELEAIASSRKLQSLGRIVASLTNAENLTLNDTIFIKPESSDATPQVGEMYTITQDPSDLVSKIDSRSGYSYRAMAKVKIMGVRDGLFVGRIESANEVFERGGSFLIPAVPRVPVLTPTAGPSAMNGTIVFDHSFSTYTTAQHKEVFLDRGNQDGVAPGMVFRVYEHIDPSNDKRITHSDVVGVADIMVAQVSEQFSAGLVIRSNSYLTEFTPAVLLTDVTDLIKNMGIHEKSLEGTGSTQPPPQPQPQASQSAPSPQASGEPSGIGEPPPPPPPAGTNLDELDKLDTGGNLGKDEEKELKQLEKWKGNPPAAPEAAPTPGTTEAVPPPPPEETAPPPPPTETAPPALSPQAPPAAGAPPPPPPAPEAAPPPPPAAEAPPPPAAGSPPPPAGSDVPPPPPPMDEIPPPPGQ